MKYLNDYGFSDDDISSLCSVLSDYDLIEFSSYRRRISELLDYLKSIGFINFKDLLFKKPKIVYIAVDDLKKFILECDTVDIIKLLNEDVNNFNLLGIEV